MLLKECILSFPHLEHKHAFDSRAEPKYQATFIVPKDHPQIQELKDAEKEAIFNLFGDETPTMLNSALHDGSEMAKHNGYNDDVVYLVAKTDKRPGLYDQRREPILPDDSRLYAGAIVNASIDFYVNKKFPKNVAVGLRGVQFWKEGTPLGGGAPAQADDFPEYDGSDDDDFLE